MEVCEELRKRKVDVCGSKEVIAKFDLSGFWDEGINYDGLETVLVSEGLKFW